MKIKIEIKNRFTGSIIFSFEKEGNTMKDTVEKAIKYGANLDGANLDGANLVRANLDGANLVRANLDGANLVRANLVRANLDGANLPIYAKWPVAMKMTEDGVFLIKIGCKEKTIKEWDKWFKSTEEYSTKRGTVDFKRIEGMYKAFKAYISAVGIENLFPKNPEQN